MDRRRTPGERVPLLLPLNLGIRELWKGDGKRLPERRHGPLPPLGQPPALRGPARHTLPARSADLPAPS